MRPYIRELSPTEASIETLRHLERFKFLREMHQVRHFRLVLYADAYGPVGEHVVRMLKEVVAKKKARGEFGAYFPEPAVTTIAPEFSYVKVRP